MNRNGPDKMIKSSTFCCVTPALSKNKNKKKAQDFREKNPPPPENHQM